MVTDSLICAIDGENVSFALAGGASELGLEAVRHFRTADFPTFTDALQSYAGANGIGGEALKLGLAVAGIAKGDVISFANCRWYLSVSGLKAFLRTDPLIINDFAATAWSLLWANEDAFMPIASPAPPLIRSGGTFLVVGTGVGLGMATLSVRADGSTVALESEGGHASFAPQSAAEDALLASLRRRFGHVSYERLLSHQGLQFLYSAVAERQGLRSEPPDPYAIIAASSRGDALARETVEIFASVLGSFVGNGVLTVGAWDGVFLVGDLMREMVPLLGRSRFRSQMAAKGRMARALERVPTSFARSEHSCLTGAAAALRARG
jgi:glucokinase